MCRTISMIHSNFNLGWNGRLTRLLWICKTERGSHDTALRNHLHIGTEDAVCYASQRE